MMFPIIAALKVEYLIKKISTAMNHDWDPKLLEDVLCQNPSLREGLPVWALLDYIHTGRLLKITSIEAFSLALDDVFQEMYHNVLKKVNPATSYGISALLYIQLSADNIMRD